MQCFSFEYTNSLVNADLFYVNFTNTTFQKIPIPHLTLFGKGSESKKNTRV